MKKLSDAKVLEWVHNVAEENYAYEMAQNVLKYGREHFEGQELINFIAAILPHERADQMGMYMEDNDEE